MSIILYVVENNVERDIWRLAEERSKIFLGIAEAIGQVWKMPTGLHPSSPVCRVEPDEFCALVEKVFEQPSELLHPWAQEAAGIYEVIKGEYYIWQWSRYRLPIEVFKVTRYREISNMKHSQRRIGSND